MFTPQRNFLTAMPRPLAAAAVLLAVMVPPLMGQMAGSRGATERVAAAVADMPLFQSPVAKTKQKATPAHQKKRQP